MRLTGTLNRGLLSAVALLVASPAFGAFGITQWGLYNTGVDGTGTAVAADSTADAHYTVVRTSSPLAGISGIVAPSNTYPLPGPWISNASSTDSKWAGVSTNGSALATEIDPSPGPNGLYSWTTTFNIPALTDLSSVILQGRWATDNPGTNIIVTNASNPSGVATGNTAGGYSSWYNFSIPGSLLTTGANTLTFLVTNEAFTGAGGNPTGLRVEFTAVPEASSFLVIGLGGVFAFGAIGLGKRYGISLKV